MTEVVEVATTQLIGVVDIDQQVISVGLGSQVIEAGYMQPGGTVGDKSFDMPFNSMLTVTVPHNLEKHPSVTVVDTANNVVIADVQYVNNNVALVSFAQVNSGMIYCN